VTVAFSAVLLKLPLKIGTNTSDEYLAIGSIAVTDDAWDLRNSTAAAGGFPS
jgi:hypothetical protein